MPKAVVYLRVSTDEQAHSGLGLEAQTAACLAAAQRLGFAACESWSDEGTTGAAPLDQRLGLMDAVGRLGKGDLLLVAKRDRLARDPIALATIEAAVIKRGARVVSAAGEGTEDDEPASILMRRIVDAFAEYERLLIKARTRAALAAKARRGERTGQIPYGKRLAEDGRTLLTDPLELHLIAGIRARHRNGQSARSIARDLNDAGVRPKNGGRWAHSTIRRLLARDSHHGHDQVEAGQGGDGPRHQ